MGVKEAFRKIVFFTVLLLVVIQFVPVDRSNPEKRASLRVSSEIEAVLRRSCFDCHSNETVWPWYSYVAPISWLVAKDIHEGRENVNFSDWEDYSAEDRRDIKRHCVKEVKVDAMPLKSYRLLHPSSKITEADLALLEQWAQQP